MGENRFENSAHFGSYRRSAVWRPCGVTPHAALKKKSVAWSGSQVTNSTVMKLHGSDNRGGINVKTYTKSTCSHMCKVWGMGLHIGLCVCSVCTGRNFWFLTGIRWLCLRFWFVVLHYKVFSRARWAGGQPMLHSMDINYGSWSYVLDCGNDFYI